MSHPNATRDRLSARLELARWRWRREFRLPLLSELRAAELGKIEGYPCDAIAFRRGHFEHSPVDFAAYSGATLRQPRQCGMTEGRNRVLGLHEPAAAVLSALAAACIESKFCAITEDALKRHRLD